MSLFWYALLSVLSSFAIILKRKKELVGNALFYYLTDVLLLQMLCVSSSRYRGFVCSVRLWYFLIILTYFFGT